MISLKYSLSVSIDCPALGTRVDNLNQCNETGLSGGSCQPTAWEARLSLQDEGSNVNCSPGCWSGLQLSVKYLPNLCKVLGPRLPALGRVSVILSNKVNVAEASPQILTTQKLYVQIPLKPRQAPPRRLGDSDGKTDPYNCSLLWTISQKDLRPTPTQSVHVHTHSKIKITTKPQMVGQDPEFQNSQIPDSLKMKCTHNPKLGLPKADKVPSLFLIPRKTEKKWPANVLCPLYTSQVSIHSSL